MKSYLNLNSLQSACDHDSDLVSLINKQLNVRKILQVLYITSGCDFVSYFAHIGKPTFLKLFFQHAHFINGCYSNTQGHLAQTELNVNSDDGLMSFYRLIMCIYYHVNRSCLHNYNSIIDLYNSIEDSDIMSRHHKALDIVRLASWKGEYEDDLLPSNSALNLHWLRSYWVSTVWDEVNSPIFIYPNISFYGYNVTNQDDKNKVSIIWDTEENINRIRENVIYLTRGCACSKSKCTNRLCKCVKDKRKCGPGCRCKHCENVPNVTIPMQSTPTCDTTTEYSADRDDAVDDDDSIVSSTLSILYDEDIESGLEIDILSKDYDRESTDSEYEDMEI
nr:uncharacterized protein LOC129254459 [Lytechinus pictus]